MARQAVSAETAIGTDKVGRLADGVQSFVYGAWKGRAK